MPINYDNYHKDWHSISAHVRFKRAKNRCEWKYPNGSRCAAINGEPHPVTGSKVVLTVAHLNHDIKDNLLSNLMAMCQLHHLRYDAQMKAEKIKARIKAHYEQLGIPYEAPARYAV